MEILKRIRNFFNNPKDEYRVVKKVSICPVMLVREEEYVLQMFNGYDYKDIKSFPNLDYAIIYRDRHKEFIENQDETIIKI